MTKYGNPFEASAALGIVRGWDEFSGSDFLKSDNGGNWSQNDAPADPGPYIPLNYRHVFQHWDNGQLVDTKDAHEFDLKELNDAIPKEEWTDQYGRPPWQRTKQVVLLNVKSGAQVIYSASNTRCIIAVTHLIDQIHSKNFLFGRTAAPVVELANAPFNTQFGMQKRGDFKVLDRNWIDLSGGHALPSTAPKQLPEPSLAEEMNDAIPDFAAKDEAPFDLEADSTPPTPVPAAKTKAKAAR